MLKGLLKYIKNKHVNVGYIYLVILSQCNKYSPHKHKLLESLIIFVTLYSQGILRPKTLRPAPRALFASGPPFGTICILPCSETGPQPWVGERQQGGGEEGAAELGRTALQPGLRIFARKQNIPGQLQETLRRGLGSRLQGCPGQCTHGHPWFGDPLSL